MNNLYLSRRVVSLGLISIMVLAAPLLVKNAYAWTSGDWSIERSQTIKCVYQINGSPGHWCMSWRAEVRADGQETNNAVDYYSITFIGYLENNTQTSVWNLDASISFASPNPGGVDTIQPQPQTRYDQTFLTLSDPASFLSVSVYVPSQQIDCLGCNLSFTHWHIWSGIACRVIGDCFNSGTYEEQGIAVALPEGQAWAINFHYNTNGMNFPVSCQATNGTPNLTACNFTWDGTINIPAGHVDPPSGTIGGGGGGMKQS